MRNGREYNQVVQYIIRKGIGRNASITHFKRLLRLLRSTYPLSGLQTSEMKQTKISTQLSNKNQFKMAPISNSRWKTKLFSQFSVKYYEKILAVTKMKIFLIILYSDSIRKPYSSPLPLRNLCFSYFQQHSHIYASCLMYPFWLNFATFAFNLLF